MKPGTDPDTVQIPTPVSSGTAARADAVTIAVPGESAVEYSDVYVTVDRANGIVDVWDYATDRYTLRKVTHYATVPLAMCFIEWVRDAEETTEA